MAILMHKHQNDLLLKVVCLKSATFGQIRQNYASVAYWYTGVTWGTPVHMFDIAFPVQTKSDYLSHNTA